MLDAASQGIARHRDLAPTLRQLLGEAADDSQLSVEAVEAGTHGALQWRADGRWLYASADIDEPADGDLAGLVRRAYLELFACLRRSGYTHPLRIWNYLPHINAEQAGLERYRHFNAGRQQAFLEAGHAAFEGAPAACALGSHGGPYCLRVLAARTPAVPIENPRQVSAYHYPAQYGPRAPSFSRAVLADAGGGDLLLLVSGTASIVGHATLHVGDVQAQLHETLRNLRAVLAVAASRGASALRLEDLVATIYLRHAADAPALRQALQRELGAEAPLLQHAMFLEADICREDLLVEIEAYARCRGQLR